MTRWLLLGVIGLFVRWPVTDGAQESGKKRVGGWREGKNRAQK